ncbi:pyridoxal phosphate-dependent transferase [Entophlyctis helioformis]|nr:pyridoxal phosphate-dependent transferase [Entophlyctis helioformis]
MSSVATISLLLRMRPVEVLKNILLGIFLTRAIRILYRSYRIKGILGSLRSLIHAAGQSVSNLLRAGVPGVDRIVQAEIDKQIAAVQRSMVPDVPGEHKYITLPEEGLSDRTVRTELARYKAMGHVDWEGGRVSGAIYHGGDDLSSIITEAYGMFVVSNPLHPEVFPGVRKMEAEIVSMVGAMYNGPPGVCGSVTSGGTESILMAVKTYRDMAKALRGVTEPEIIVPITVHAAFDKAAAYFCMKIVHIPVNSVTGKVDVSKVAAAINFNTVMIVGSAPGFPHGIIDDLPALAALAKKNKIGMHIDACLGGFLVPFAEAAGFPLPHPCDFRIDGVTSISVDPHKYGFAPKGTSVVLYRSKDIRKYQYFVQTEWPGGIYGSPSIAGSRPGALIAGCWTAMLRFGLNGYASTAKDIIGAARRIRAGVSEIDGLRVLGEPLLSVVAFEAVAPIKTYAVADILSRKGWHLNILQAPPSIHIACTLLTVNAVDDLLADIEDTVETLRKDPSAGKGDVAAIYGTAASVPDRRIISDVTRGFLDGLTKI